VLVGKLVPYYVIGLCQLAFVFGLGALLFGLKAAGSLSSLVVLTAVVVGLRLRARRMRTKRMMRSRLPRR
jgi:hypothetical protein